MDWTVPKSQTELFVLPLKLRFVLLGSHLAVLVRSNHIMVSPNNEKRIILVIFMFIMIYIYISNQVHITIVER